jgi:hypothetical protein
MHLWNPWQVKILRLDRADKVDAAKFPILGAKQLFLCLHSRIV